MVLFGRLLKSDISFRANGRKWGLMRDQSLMQAALMALFRDKPGGLMVDYIGLAYELKHALATYTESGGGGIQRSTRARQLPLCWRSTRFAATSSTALTGRSGRPEPSRNASASCPWCRTHPGPGRRQEPPPQGREWAFQGVRAGHPPQGGPADPGRRGLLPSGAGGAGQAGPGRGLV